MNLLRKLLPLIAACSLLAALAASAVGQGTTPTAPCGSYADKAGDASPENLDITEFWFETKAGKVTANLRLANLTKDVPIDATGANWYILWTGPEDVQYFVTASVSVDAPEPAFAYGSVDGNLRQQVADIPGKFIEGKDGVIQFSGIPAETGAKSGSTLKGPIADTATSTGVILSLLTTIDEATGRNYTVAPCDGQPATSPTPEPSPGATPTPAPTTQPGQQPGPGTQQTGAAGKLDVKIKGKLPAAKKIKKSLTVGLTSAKGVKGLQATLYQGDIRANKIVAKGKASKVGKKTKLKLKVTKKLKKGKYTLYLVGKNADGQTADRKLSIKLK